MKRSEMIKNIVDVLFYGSLAARVDNRNEMITLLAEKDANDVLELMEKAGMSPPLKHPIHHYHLDQIQALDLTFRIWEEETDP